MPRRPVGYQALAEVSFHATARAGRRCWWNALPFQFELATRIEDELPDLVEALDKLTSLFRRWCDMLGLQDELATIVRILHSRLGLDEGGVP
jgi:hypothetical protein